jgi:hypothetical protein
VAVSKKQASDFAMLIKSPNIALAPELSRADGVNELQRDFREVI